MTFENVPTKNELILASAIHFWLKKIKCSDLTDFELKLFRADLKLANKVLRSNV